MPSLMTTLTSDQLNAHRGTAGARQDYRAEIFVSLNANTTVYSGRVNQTMALYPSAEIPYDGGSGDLSAVMVGMTVLLSHINDKKAAYFRGRIRKVPTADVLYVNEQGSPIDDDDYFWVIEDFAPQIKLDRYTDHVVTDWDRDFDGLRPIIGGVQAVYASRGLATLTIDLAPTVLAAQSGASIVSYLWTLPASGATITSGSTTTKDITVEIDAGVQCWLHVTATDDGGREHTLHIKVFNDGPTLLDISNISLSCEVPIDVKEGASSGFSGTFDVKSGVDDILERTLACVWVDEVYGGVRGSQVGNILAVGRLVSEEDGTTYDASGRRSQATMTLEGPLAQLAAINAPSFQIDNGDGATDVVLKVPDLTLWRGIWALLSEFTTFAECFPVEFADTSDTFVFKSLVTQGGDILASLADLAMSVNMVFQQAPDGRCALAYRGVMLDDDARDDLPVIADLGEKDIFGHLGYQRDYRPKNARLNADGGGFTSGTNKVSAYLAVAPPGAPLDAPDDTGLPRQVLAAGQSIANEQAELVARAGHALAASQPPTTLSPVLIDGYHWIAPSADAWWTFTLAARHLTGGRAFTTATRLWLTKVDINADPQSGRIEVNPTFVVESSGSPGAIQDMPTVDTGQFGNFNLDEIAELPPIDVGAFDSDLTLSQEGWVISFGHYTPGAGVEGDCPDGATIVDIYKDYGEPVTAKAITVAYNSDYTGGETNQNRVWTRSSGTQDWELAKEWTTQDGPGNELFIPLPNKPVRQVRVLAYGGDDCDGSITITDIRLDGINMWQEPIDFTESDGGWEPRDVWDDDSPMSTYVAATGWQHTDGEQDSVADRSDEIKLVKAIPHLTEIDVELDYTYGALSSGEIIFEARVNGAAVGSVHAPTVYGDGHHSEAVLVSVDDVTSIELILQEWTDGAGPGPSGSGLFTKVTLRGTGVNPFA